MRRPIAGLALALALLPLLGGCYLYDSFRCGYGGAGCGDPALMGLCHGEVIVGQPARGTFVYYDDTGAWGATIEQLTSSTPELLVVSRDDDAEEGRVQFTGLQPGLGIVEVQLTGWEGARHEFAIQVIEEEGAYDEPTPHPMPGTPQAATDGGMVDDGGVVTCQQTLAPL